MSNKIIKKLIYLSHYLPTIQSPPIKKISDNLAASLISDSDEAIKIHNPNSPFPFYGIFNFNTVKIINVSSKAKY